jgi:hypothetical protein
MSDNARLTAFVEPVSIARIAPSASINSIVAVDDMSIISQMIFIKGTPFL